MVTVLSLFINKLTTPRTLSNDELLINGLFLFDTPKEISDFEFFSSNSKSITKSDLMGKWTLMYFGFTNCPADPQKPGFYDGGSSIFEKSRFGI